MSELHRLKERIEQAEGPDRVLDAAIARALGAEARFIGKLGWRMRRAPWNTWSSGYWETLPDFTASLDAATALVERLLSEWRWEVRSVGTAILHQQEDYDGINDVVEVAATAPLALLSALLTALSKDPDHA